MAAITQIRHKHSDGRAYYQRKIAEGKTRKEALRCLKRRISDAIYAALVADARQAATATGPESPGGQQGNLSASRAAGSHPEHRLFGSATPGPGTTLRPAGGETPPPAHRAAVQMPGTDAGGSSRTTPHRNRRPKAISKKSTGTP
jgi:hypothetical protein